MSSLLLRRLDSATAAGLIEAAQGATIQALASATPTRVNDKCYTVAATGGTPVTDEHLSSVAGQLRSIAKASGYPDPQRRKPAQRRFDIEVSQFLFDGLGAIRGELLRDEVWQYLTCVLVPDLVVWRFGDGSEDGVVVEERFLGGIRNCLGRLWRRADLLRDDQLKNPWQLIEGLLEDNCVAILERPRIARNPPLAREVARASLLRRDLVVEALGARKFEDFVRDVLKRVIRVNVHQALTALETPELADAVGKLADDSLKSFEVPVIEAERLGDQHPELQVDLGMEVMTPAPEKPVAVVVPRTIEPSLPAFATLETAGRVRAVWEAVVGLGSRTSDEIVRLAAENLRRRGQVNYERLRETGSIYQSIAITVEVGRTPKHARFDAPERGYRRATCATVEEVPPWLWARLIGPFAETVPHLRLDRFFKDLAYSLEELVGLSISNTHGQKALQEMLVRDGYFVARNDRLWVPTVVAEAPEDVWWGWDIRHS